MNISLLLSRKSVQYTLLIAATFAIYANSLWNGFVYDDADLLLRNSWIRDFSHIREIFSSSIGTFLNGYQTGTYRPGVHVVYMLQHALFGLEPWGFHLVSVLLYALTVLMVHMTASRLFVARYGAWFPFLAAGYFAVHTGHSEVVSWVSAQAEIFFTLFLLAGLRLHTSDRPSYVKCALAGLCLFMGLLFKETALAMVPLFILYDVVLRENSGRRHIVSYLSLAVFIFLYFLIRHMVLITDMPGQNVYNLTAFQYAINMVHISGFYFFKLLIPVGLTAYYYIQPLGSIAEPMALISLLYAFVLLVGALYFYRRDRSIFFSLGWVVLSMLPTLYLPGLGKSMFADRYLFLPSVGFAFLFALIVIKIARTGLPKPLKASAAVLLAVYIGLLGFGTIQRNFVWQESQTLWQDAVFKYPSAPLPHYNLGLAHADKGDMDGAIREFELAVKYDSSYTDARYNLGVLYSRKGMLDEAVVQFAETIRLSPRSADAHYQLGIILRSKGHVDEADAMFRAAGELNPAFRQASVY